MTHRPTVSSARPPLDLDALLEPLCALALEAGACILRHYRPDVAVVTKGDGSPVTQADGEAEAIILEGLARLAPDIPVVAEEEAAAGRCPDASARFFLVDPLDGTREFITGNGEFTVNIALIESGVPVLGVVYAPALGRLFAGGPEGAWCRNGEDGRDPMRVRAAPGPLTVVGSRSHGSAETADFLERLPVAGFAACGSSLKFCMLAAGEADFYPRFGRTMEWDTAAGDAILRAAGGCVTTCDGQPLRYGKRQQAHDADFANPHFLAFGDPAILPRACPDAASPAS
ncbi:3'(2'),5'-bisphosphate nucleotidase CysQ [Aureimonas sp. Leaf324]|uniref:3'(2'),5'-bisphosphate nucleotidase CysQ n=1 Tax=Aureimonas sp. Leaf324 TaxID=1736336 RepID=UPI0006F85FEB|nr:3'(2'),5'-bisphosphate nucleotidase CysQ [Aureimonas sp. Leaf324]KQQ79039.1 3'(2'),5'-bisphosphate nucleotidase CysQ [Aureimonas sp. Leaf324]